MKTQALLVAFCFVLVATTPATARTPKGTSIIGTIQKVDVKAETAEMQREDKDAPITFTWGHSTTFFVNWKIADFTILKKGARVEVICHLPLFGKASATEVTLLPAR